MPRVDTKTLIAQTDIVSVIGRYVPLKKRGSLYATICPFHDDHKASLEVVPRKNLYKCLACDAGGDVIDFVMRFTGKSFRDAVDSITSDVPLEGSPTPAVLTPQPPIWSPLTPVPEGAPEPSFDHYRHGKPSRTWAYHNDRGELMGYTCRFDLPDGSKEVLPLTYCASKDKQEWRWQGLPAPRPLYKLHYLAASPDALVIVVEGEKTADALQAVLHTAVVVSWIGGANGIHLADWSPLHGRRVLIWPDNDWQGIGAAIQIGRLLDGHVQRLEMIANPAGVPRGWDFADSGWDTPTTRAWINANHGALPAPEAGAPPAWAEACQAWWLLRHPDTGEAARYLFLRDDRFVGQRIPEAEPAPEPELPPLPPIESYEDPLPGDFMPPFQQPEGYVNPFEDAPFLFLGFDKSDSGEIAYYFYIHTAKKVTRLTGSKLTKAGFLSLAHLNWWEDRFPKKSGFDLDSAMNWIIQTSHSKGVFKPKNIRGRGAWIDKSRTVLHVGHHLIVNGTPAPLGSIDSRYIYEQAEPLELEAGQPLHVRDANHLVKMLELVNWERPISAYLLAGWCVIAPICGALKWRPHVWLTGSAGTGKSWILHNVVRRLLGECALVAQGETSEAGLRQQLGNDALPVLFDEAEGEDRRAADRMQQILALARAASTDDGGLIIKGTAGHSSKSFTIRSCFAFASISPQVSGQADRSRVTLLSIRRNPDEERSRSQWEQLQSIYHRHITDDFVRGLQARTISMMATILKNAATFSNAAALVIGEQRTGDQLGAVLAGAYALHSNGEITFEDAVDWIRQRDWSEEKSLDQTKDEAALLRLLLEQTVVIESHSSKFSRTVMECINIYRGGYDIDAILPDRAEMHLKRIGFIVDGGRVIIANQSEWIRRTLRDTPWNKNHSKILLRIPGAVATQPTRFAGGLQSRAVSVPLELIG